MSDEGPFVTVSIRQSRDAGSCNACSRYITTSGCAEHQIAEIHLHRSSFRLCNDCREELRIRLNTMALSAEKGRMPTSIGKNKPIVMLRANLAAALQEVIDGRYKAGLPETTQVAGWREVWQALQDGRPVVVQEDP